ncbi:hypothetical protein [Ralstonia pickettii]|uniref:hypothetical protein n=1 Tax=Ralstonia pickettii TaxID=329 RepID=UPI0004685D5C|nr:hypothetical protein [Ralstonia pickettii]
MKTEKYVEVGKWVTDHIGPINAVITISTATLLPVLDFLRPYFPYISYVAVGVVMLFLMLLVMKLMGLPRGTQLHSSLVVCSGVCATAFSVGAIASAKHADAGGLIASASPLAAQIQRLLVDTHQISEGVDQLNRKLDTVKKETSTNPRKELANRGVMWTDNEFLHAIDHNDAETVSLFMDGGMPWDTGRAQRALRDNKSRVVEVLLQHPELLERRAGDCAQIMSSVVRIEPRQPDAPAGSRDDKAHVLSDIEKRFLKSVCSTPEDIAHAQKEYVRTRKEVQESQDMVDRGRAEAAPDKCVGRLMANDAFALRSNIYAIKYNPIVVGHLSDGIPGLNEAFRLIYEGMEAKRQVPTARLAPIVEKYCRDQAASYEPNIAVMNWLPAGWKQVLDTVSAKG